MRPGQPLCLFPLFGLPYIARYRGRAGSSRSYPTPGKKPRLKITMSQFLDTTALLPQPHCPHALWHRLTRPSTASTADRVADEMAAHPIPAACRPPFMCPHLNLCDRSHSGLTIPATGTPVNCASGSSGADPPPCRPGGAGRAGRAFSAPRLPLTPAMLTVTMATIHRLYVPM